MRHWYWAISGYIAMTALSGLMNMSDFLPQLETREQPDMWSVIRSASLAMKTRLTLCTNTMFNVCVCVWGRARFQWAHLCWWLKIWHIPPWPPVCVNPSHNTAPQSPPGQPEKHNSINTQPVRTQLLIESYTGEVPKVAEHVQNRFWFSRDVRCLQERETADVLNFVPPEDVQTQSYHIYICCTHTLYMLYYGSYSSSQQLKRPKPTEVENN